MAMAGVATVMVIPAIEVLAVAVRITVSSHRHHLTPLHPDEVYLDNNRDTILIFTIKIMSPDLCY
jgi:hypothetical protein